MYSPQVPPQQPEELLPYLSDEFLRVAQAFNAVDNGEWPISGSIPDKYKAGTVKYFNGTTSNPLGTGKEGPYFYGADGQWHFMGNVPYVPPPDPVPTAWTAITPTNGWTVSTNFIFRKWSYRVDVVLGLAAGTLAMPGPVVIGSLPVGFRPIIDCSYPLVTNTLGDISGLPRIRVRTNGDIDIFNVPTGVSSIFCTLSVPIDVL